MISLFSKRWNAVPTCWIDVETTGTVPGSDGAVQVALVRFEGGVEVARFSSLVDPCREIPEAATAIHGITNEQVRGAPTIEQVFQNLPQPRELLAGSQCGAFNAEFDRRFLPAAALCFEDKEGWRWPWFDSLSWVRMVDRFVRGAGRHKLGAACERRGITIDRAHDAASDAAAAGVLFYRIVPEGIDEDPIAVWTVGEILRRQREADTAEWFRFVDWLSRQPPREDART